MAGSVTGRLQQTQGAVLKQVEVTIDFENVELPDLSEVVLAIDRAGPGVRPHSVADLIALNDVDGVRKIRHAAGMIEGHGQVEQVTHVLWLHSQLLQCGVNSVLTLEFLRSKRRS